MDTLTSKDRQLLELLQKNGMATSLELSEHLGMSASQVGRRRQRLEAEGYIRATPARLSPAKLGLSVQAFVQVQTAAHSDTSHLAVEALLQSQPEIVGAWTLTGEADYMFRVYCEDLRALNRLIQDVLLPHPAIGRVQSQVVMDEIFDETALPLPRA